MEHLHECRTPLDTDSYKSFQVALSNVQENILRAHRQKRALHILLTFPNNQRLEVKSWIASLAGRITSALGQSDRSEPPCAFVGFLLSASGYAFLDPHFAHNKAGFASEAFCHGMRAAQWRLNDPAWWKTWEEPYQRDIHAMLLLADSNEDVLEHAMSTICQDIRPYIVTVERGKAMWMPDETDKSNVQGCYRVEHFGYRDGISKPLFFPQDIQKAEPKGDATNIYPSGAAPALALVQDPYGRPGDCGSYLVFRKLEQRVRDFKTQELKLATELDLQEGQAEALIMGRFRNGTPIILSPTAEPALAAANHFTYKDDPDGQICPLQAHIRAVNPRRRGIPYIVRRGMTYGDREKEPKHNPRLEELPIDGVGLLFMCYQSNIEKQFEVLQGLLANDPRRPPFHAGGIDPVIGQTGSLGPGQQLWPRERNAPHAEHIPHNFFQYVSLKGGEYFFAPSRHFLQKIQSILPES